MKKVKVFLGADHAGFKLKELIKIYLFGKDYDLIDLSPDYKEGDDYPEHAFRLARKVKKSKDSKGILICGSGIGVCIAANRMRGIRAANAYDSYTARMSRADEDSNILCLRARNFNVKTDFKIIQIWLSTKFSNGTRHIRRVKELDK